MNSNANLSEPELERIKSSGSNSPGSEFEPRSAAFRTEPRQHYVLYTETLPGPPHAWDQSPEQGRLHVRAGAWNAKPSEWAHEHCK
jgi:hypothetical protein